MRTTGSRCILGVQYATDCGSPQLMHPPPGVGSDTETTGLPSLDTDCLCVGAIGGGHSEGEPAATGSAAMSVDTLQILLRGGVGVGHGG